MLNTDILGCGHLPTSTEGCGTGYARTSEGRTLCYSCADDAQRADIQTADRFTAYVSTDGRTLTTWSGGTLGRVQQISAPAYTPTGGEYRYVYARAAGVDWWGRGGGPGMYVNLRRCA